MRRFGIEVEHANSKSHREIADLLAAAGLPVDFNMTGRRRGNHPTYTGWQTQTDGTIRTQAAYPHGIELVSPPLPFSPEGEEAVTKALEIVRPFGKVNRSCGLHVHIEARDLNDAQLGRLETFFKRWGKVLMSYVTRSRRNNNMCKPTTSRHDRYVALNLVPYAAKGTVEFRLHQSTLNTQKILAFVALCHNIVEFAKSDKTITPDRIVPTLNGDAEIVKVYKGQTFKVKKEGVAFHVEPINQTFDSLTAAAKAIRQSPVEVSGPRFFGYPMLLANAMDSLCRTVALEGEKAEFLKANYERNVNVHGYFEGSI